MSADLREMSDAGLVVAISRYHQDALAEAYRRHAGAVFGLARRLTGLDVANFETWSAVRFEVASLDF